jgi:hypothetical protein
LFPWSKVRILTTKNAIFLSDLTPGIRHGKKVKMEKFLLLIREDLKRRAQLSPADYRHQCDLVGEWIDKMTVTGNYLDASALYDQGKYVSKNVVVSDGPFLEAKESISGFILIQADDLEHATRLAQACTFVHTGYAVIEVRPMQEDPRVNMSAP